MSYWLRALHALGIVHVVSLSALPPVADASAFAQAWTAATRAGRVLSLIYAMGFVLAFSYLLRTLVRDWRIAAFGGFLLAFSGGMAMEMRIMRTELLAAAFFFSALLMLLIVAQRGERWWRPIVIGWRQPADHAGDAQQDSVPVSDRRPADSAVAVRHARGGARLLA